MRQTKRQKIFKQNVSCYSTCLSEWRSGSLSRNLFTTPKEAWPWPMSRYRSDSTGWFLTPFNPVVIFSITVVSASWPYARTTLAMEEAAPCLTDGIGSSKLWKNIGYSDGRAARDSSGKQMMKLPQARHAAVKTNKYTKIKNKRKNKPIKSDSGWQSYKVCAWWCGLSTCDHQHASLW